MLVDCTDLKFDLSPRAPTLAQQLKPYGLTIHEHTLFRLQVSLDALSDLRESSGIDEDLLQEVEEQLLRRIRFFVCPTSSGYASGSYVTLKFGHEATERLCRLRDATHSRSLNSAAENAINLAEVVQIAQSQGYTLCLKDKDGNIEVV